MKEECFSIRPIFSGVDRVKSEMKCRGQVYLAAIGRHAKMVDKATFANAFDRHPAATRLGIAAKQEESYIMAAPQLVGLACAVCGKTIPSIAEGIFCPECSNPVHLRCQPANKAAVAAGLCAVCGGDPQSDMAVSVRAAMVQELTENTRRIACPSCGSTRGFRPFQREQMSATSRNLRGGLLLFLVNDLAVGGELQCMKCECVFHPRNRVRDIGCIAVVFLLVVGLVLYLALYRS
jgi:hypothetical protein